MRKERIIRALQKEAQDVWDFCSENPEEFGCKMAAIVSCYARIFNTTWWEASEKIWEGIKQ